MINKKVLVVADAEWWVFDKIYRGIMDNIEGWDVGVHYTKKSGNIDHSKYSVVLFLCDYQYHLIEKNNIPRDKLVLAIRSNVRHAFYNDPQKVVNVARVIAVSNQKLYDRFSKMHPNVILAPGGVDTDKFYFSDCKIGSQPVVGWAGSSRNFGEAFRGLHIIRKACANLNFVFNPAIREDRMRSEDEMVKYYHEEIDIYVDMSESAGRQNGLIEAAACGLPIISSHAGIADSLIVDGENGIICERNVNALVSALRKIIPMANKCGKNIRNTIDREWSWKSHVKIFEEVFNKMVEPTELELYPSPNDDWDLDYVDLLQDAFISKKYNRRARLKEQNDHINKNLPIIKNGGGYVFDIGTGPGEFLEICRFYGNRIIGVECRAGVHNMMGRKYHKLSELLHNRQCIDIKYDGFENYLENGRLPFDDCSLSIINSQGSIEQVFKDYMRHDNENGEGWIPSHDGLWIFDEKLIALFTVFFREANRVLIPGGVLLIYGNGSKNYHEYHKMIVARIDEIDSLNIIKTDSRRYHKIVKDGS